MTTLPHSLERQVLIVAPRSTVFRYFTDSTRFAAWWGAGSTIEPTPNGTVHIRYPNGIMVSGQVLEIVPDERIVFTYGYVANPSMIPPGGSRVSITLESQPGGTLLRLRHEFAEPAIRDEHARGWRYQLALFANVVAEESLAQAERAIDGFYAAWSQTDRDACRRELQAVADPDIVFRDRFAAVVSLEELVQHIEASQLHMPGQVLSRDGPVLQCQGTATSGWLVRGAGGTVSARGSNVFDFGPEGRLRRVIGLWSPA